MQKGKRVAYAIGIVVCVFGGTLFFTNMLTGNLPNTVTEMYQIMAVAAVGAFNAAAWMYKEFKGMRS